VDTEVEIDAVTPTNNNYLPTSLYDSNNTMVDPATFPEQQAQTTELTAIKTAVEIMDDWDESDRAKVNLIAGEAGVEGGSGIITSKTQRVVLATNQPEVDVRLTAIVSTNIATTTPLGSGATYTSSSEQLLDYENVGLSIETDRSGTAYFEFSQDNITWYATFAYPVTVATPGTPEAFYYQVISKERYFRLRYVNGGTAQGVFRVQSILRQVGGVGEVQAVGQALVGQESALVTKGVMYGLSSSGGGAYVAAKVNPSGSLETNATANVTQLNSNTIATGSGVVTTGTQRVVLATDVALPAGTNVIGALSANQSVNVAQINGVTVSMGNGVSGTGVQRVTIASDSTGAIKQGGKSVVTTVRNDYTSTSVTTGAWVQLVASLSAAVSEIDIFDSSGQTLELGTGAAASETRLLIITPGGNSRLPVAIAAGTRVSVRAISGTASVGELDINFFGV
jgi:hypothetical protein